jgi:hypothetical protein
LKVETLPTNAAIEALKVSAQKPKICIGRRAANSQMDMETDM